MQITFCSQEIILIESSGETDIKITHQEATLEDVDMDEFGFIKVVLHIRAKEQKLNF